MKQTYIAVTVPQSGPEGKIFFMLNSTEHEIFPAHNVKMPKIVSRKNSILDIPEPEKC